MSDIEFCKSCGSLNLSYKLSSGGRGFFVECSECGERGRIYPTKTVGRAAYLRSEAVRLHREEVIRCAQSLKWTAPLESLYIWHVDTDFSPENFAQVLGWGSMRHNCPVCGSWNVSRGINPDTSNVVYVCNHCSYREVEFYAESSRQAEQYLRGTLPRTAGANHQHGDSAESKV